MRVNPGDKMMTTQNNSTRRQATIIDDEVFTASILTSYADIRLIKEL